MIMTIKTPRLNKTSASPAEVQKSASKIKLEEFEKEVADERTHLAERMKAWKEEFDKNNELTKAEREKIPDNVKERIAAMQKESELLGPKMEEAEMRLQTVEKQINERVDVITEGRFVMARTIEPPPTLQTETTTAEQTDTSSNPNPTHPSPPAD